MMGECVGGCVECGECVGGCVECPVSALVGGMMIGWITGSVKE